MKKLLQQTQLNKRETGQIYERLAADYLCRQDHKIIQLNYNTKFGEIDIISRHQNTLVFTEVKYRNNNRYGHAAEMVTYAKQQRLIKTAMIWLKQQKLSIEKTQFRFDIIAIENNGKDIQWIQNAITN